MRSDERPTSSHRHHGLQPEAVVELIMKIVDIEDRHRIKSESRITSGSRE